MKILNTLCLVTLFMSSAFAEPTPSGAKPTFTNNEGKPFTLYYMDGTPVPAGTRMFITGIGVNLLVNDKGETIGTAFNTPEEAQKAREAKPDCSGAVFGPGPGGIPAGCPGSSNTSSSGNITEVNEEDYNKKVYELAVVLSGANEIGAKSCKGAGDEMPGSLSNWWGAVKSYASGEIARDKLLNERIAGLEQKMGELTKGDGSTLQVDSIQLQIDTVSASIESVNGENGRIPLREKLILAALKSTETNSKENTTTMEAYFNLRDKAFASSLEVAKAACERKKKIEKCETDEEGNKSCKVVEEKDPVPGCEVVQEQIPVMKAGALQSYGEVYLSKMQSEALNDRMQMFANYLKDTMAALPRSNDANYDWSSPMEAAFTAMEKARKKSGAKCPDGETALAEVEKNEKSETKTELSANAKKIVGGAGAFMEKLGIGGNKDAMKGYMEAWKAADAVIGQAANRPEYFDYVTEKANAILEADRMKLQNLLAAKSKLETYLAKLKNALANGTSGSGAKSSTVSNAKQNEAPAKLALATQSLQQVSAANVGGVNQGGSLTNTSAAAVTIGDQKSLSLSTVAETSSSGIGLSASSGSSFSSAKMSTGEGLSLSGASMAIAKKSLANISQNQKKIAEKSNSILPTSTPNPTTGSKEKTKIAHPATSSSSPVSVVNNTFGETMKGSFEKFNNTEGASEAYKSASLGGSRYESSGGSYGYYVGGSSGSSSSGSKTVTEKMLGHSAPPKISDKTAPTKASESSKVAGSEVAYQYKEASNDSRILSQSISAKKFRKKDEYDAKDSDSLFERVTKAYIRNYEKVEEERER
nr:hypothetical protein BHI3_13740 [Bacteriovorax sp. HI3]